MLPALGAVWPDLLQSIAMGLRQAPTGRSSSGGGGTPGGGGAPAPAVSYRAITAAELTSMVHVLELGCLLALQVRRLAFRDALLARAAGARRVGGS